MSGFTISASEYQALIARRDIRIAELESRLAKYEQPDDAEPVTEDWLRSTGFSSDGPQYCTHSHRDVPRLQWNDRFERFQFRGEQGPSLNHITTRGQVRRLVAALKGEPC